VQILLGKCDLDAVPYLDGTFEEQDQGMHAVPGQIFVAGQAERQGPGREQIRPPRSAAVRLGSGAARPVRTPSAATGFILRQKTAVQTSTRASVQSLAIGGRGLSLPAAQLRKRRTMDITRRRRRKRFRCRVTKDRQGFGGKEPPASEQNYGSHCQ
jgi:hypothetical protein